MPDAMQPGLRVAGIGASAGGIEALREFFDALPNDLGLAYAVVVHLAPDHESHLAAILARRTRMPVVEVADAESLPLQPDHVYVIAPDRRLEITDSTIGARPFDEPRVKRAAVDAFFRSLADRHGDGFAVILSGGGSDGAAGAKAVKEAGGVVLVQDPREATHEAMPRAVIASGVADVVLPVRALAARLAELARVPVALPALVEDGSATRDEEEIAFSRVLDLVRARTGHDFARYKRPTILRRIGRRMQLAHRADLEQYLDLLRQQPEEAQALFSDLLISVTGFFRDPEAWEALRTLVIAPLLDRRGETRPLRAWVAGCATGEEAYSLAILFREELARRERARDLVIFASDIEHGVIAAAREGLYPAAIAADVSEGRLTRFFRQEGDHYRVTAEVRDCVVFAEHGVFRDPPFSRLDLVMCRNLLIYLDRDLQQQLQHVFHYGLHDGGYLFLGLSETADKDLFEPLDKQHRIFRAREVSTGRLARLPQVEAPAVRRPEAERGRAPAVDLRSPAAAHLELLETLGPPSIVVDEHWHVDHLSPSAGRFLQPRGGAPVNAVTELVRPELVDELRTALHHAFDRHEPLLSHFVPVRFNGTPHRVALLAQPGARVRGRAPRVLLTFLDAGEVRDEPPAGQVPDDALLLTLRDQARTSEEHLESMRQEHALAYEDLRAANEELQSLNEEYRSTTEELETSKEELQSVNEELQTVNSELKTKLEEASRANNDLENFMAASDIAMLFLDRDLCIKRYTPALREYFSVLAHDHGRPIADLTHVLQYDGLVRDARGVLRDLAPVEQQVQTRDGRWLTVRMRPYRTVEDKIDGVVVTLMPGRR